MLAGIVGDVIGSVYEAHQWHEKNLALYQPLPIKNNLLVTPLFKDMSWVRKNYSWTDDTLCTLALYDAYINQLDPTQTLQQYCKKYGNEDIGFGKAFKAWIENPVPYESYGNGAIMRIGFIPFLPLTLQEKIELGFKYTEISHNHIDSFTAVTDFLILCEQLKKEKENNMEQKKCLQSYLKAYKVTDTVQSMHDERKFVINALETLKQAVIIVNESKNIDEVLRNTFYVGGDSDTLACIACNLASVIYEVPAPLWDHAFATFDQYPQLKNLVEHFQTQYTINNKIINSLKK